MSRRVSSRARFAKLAEVFRSRERRLVDSHIARLCVLYEDLRIELLAISEDSIPALDVLDPANENPETKNTGKYRRNYFLRRSVGTLYEFAEGLRLLNGCPDFAEIRSAFDEGTGRSWDDASAFFLSEEGLIQRVRNDIGGHFGSRASIYSVANLSPSVVGKIEFKLDPTDARLNFVGDIAAGAFTRHLPGTTVEEQVHDFIHNVLLTGWRHSTHCAQALIAFHLWQRFGR